MGCQDLIGRVGIFLSSGCDDHQAVLIGVTDFEGVFVFGEESGNFGKIKRLGHGQNLSDAENPARRGGCLFLSPDTSPSFRWGGVRGRGWGGLLVDAAESIFKTGAEDIGHKDPNNTDELILRQWEVRAPGFDDHQSQADEGGPELARAEKLNEFGFLNFHHKIYSDLVMGWTGGLEPQNEIGLGPITSEDGVKVGIDQHADVETRVPGQENGCIYGEGHLVAGFG
jgi:hypothetical protein